MPTVLVVDDDAQIATALRRALEDGDDVVEVAGTGEEALAVAATAEPDVVVLDLGLPGMSGLEVVQRLRAWSDVPIVVLSGADTQATKVAALDAGADDYVTKPFGLDELRARIRAIRRRTESATTSAVVRSCHGLEVDLAARWATLDREHLHLTPTEWGLLEAFCAHPGKLLTHGWLLSTIWGRGYGDESRQTLRAHVRQLRAKLRDDPSDPAFIRTETGVGYRWLPQPQDVAA